LLAGRNTGILLGEEELMKTWVKILLGIAGAIVLLVASIFYFTSDLTKSGDEFFAAIASDDMEKAYGTLSTAFRAGTSQEELMAYLVANRMDKVTKTSWGNRSKRTGGVGNLAGTIWSRRMTGGKSMPSEKPSPERA
jgi:hypothetical protein